MPAAKVETFAGIDVSALELSVAVRRGEGDDKPAMAEFRDNASDHKALLAHLLRGDGRVRVCMEASGNQGLDLALTLHAHRQVEISVVIRGGRVALRNHWASAARPTWSIRACSANMPLVCLGSSGNRRAQSPYACVP